MSDFQIEWLPSNSEGARILKVTGPFTINAVFDFQAMARAEAAPLRIIDLSGVPYMDSAALGSLLGLHVSCQKEGSRYALIGVSDRLRSLFRMAGVDDFLVIRPSLEAATAGSVTS